MRGFLSLATITLVTSLGVAKQAEHLDFTFHREIPPRVASGSGTRTSRKREAGRKRARHVREIREDVGETPRATVIVLRSCLS